MSTRDLEILQHALGLDQYGRGSPSRNHFATTAGSDSYEQCQALVTRGFMRRFGPDHLFGGSSSYCFVVTEQGRTFVAENSPTPPRLTRSQRRYQRYLAQDSHLSFGEWLRAGYG